MIRLHYNWRQFERAVVEVVAKLLANTDHVACRLGTVTNKTIKLKSWRAKTEDDIRFPSERSQKNDGRCLTPS